MFGLQNTSEVAYLQVMYSWISTNIPL